MKDEAVDGDGMELRHIVRAEAEDDERENKDGACIKSGHSATRRGCHVPKMASLMIHMRSGRMADNESVGVAQRRWVGGRNGAGGLWR